VRLGGRDAPGRAPVQDFRRPGLPPLLRPAGHALLRQPGLPPDGEILRNLGKLAGIPAVLAQGVLDTSNIVGTPWLLHHGWPGSELVMLDNVGHSTQNAPMQDVLVGATDRFAR
jgi:proline iminopeptidase